MKAIIFGFLLLSASASAQVFEVTDLGTLGGATSTAAAINDANQVVGWSDNASGDERAFLWDNGSITEITSGLAAGDLSRAWDINNSGIMVGCVQPIATSIAEAMAWSAAFTPTPLGTLTVDQPSCALGLNDSSPPMIVGDSVVIGGDGGVTPISRGFRYFNGSIDQLENLIPGAGPEPEPPILPTHANDVNDSGRVAGWGLFDSNEQFGMYWDESDIVQLFSLLPVDGDEDNFVIGQAINESDRVVGAANSDVSSVTQAFRFDPASPAPELTVQTAFGLDGLIVSDGLVNEGELVGVGLDINDLGVVVGFSTRIIEQQQLQRATRWTEDTPEDLNDLVPGSGWTLLDASGINNNGCITGSGLNPAGALHGYLLCEVAPPQLTLVKTVAGGPADALDFVLRVTSDGGDPDQDGTDDYYSGDTIELIAGVDYTLGEDEAAGYVLESLVCVDDTSGQPISQPVSLQNDEAATCTFNNVYVLPVPTLSPWALLLLVAALSWMAWTFRANRRRA